MQREILLHISLISGIGPAVVEKLISAESLSEDIYRFSEKDFRARFNFSVNTAQLLVAGLSDKKLLEKELDLILKNSISWVTIMDEKYPELLKHIHLPPTVLYFKGEYLKNADNCLAIVGSRKATFYGQRVISKLVPELVNEEFILVSGGAIGADTMVHQATLNECGKTIAVIGAGLLRPYPASNTKLFEKIVQSGGTIISPFPLTLNALPGNFPARNRIISGISKGCIVIQAAAQSGALITAQYALEQGREVFAVPGQIDEELSAGCHSLIAQGATLLSSMQDVLNAFGRNSKEQLPKKQREIAPLQLSEATDQKKVFDPLLKLCMKPTSFDDLLNGSGLDFSQLQQKLFNLQLQGLITQNFMGFWEIT